MFMAGKIIKVLKNTKESIQQIYVRFLKIGPDTQLNIEKYSTMVCLKNTTTTNNIMLMKKMFSQVNLQGNSD